MSANITLRRFKEVGDAERLAKKHKQTLSYVLRLAVQHGLPVIEKKLDELRAQPAAR